MPDAVNLTMTHVVDAARLVDVAPDSTVSRTVLKDEGVARVVLFGFDTGQELSEHTTAVPVLPQVLDGRLEVTAAVAPCCCSRATSCTWAPARRTLWWRANPVIYS